jgi:N4-(beta-N-acetylglucosaminyl)-L-asparaginase
MSRKLDRRTFVRTGVAGLAAAAPMSRALGSAPAIRTRTGRPVVISDRSGFAYRNGGPENAVERAWAGIARGDDVLDSLIDGVNIPENDPEETGIGYGGLPNADGVVQLDACCMHGPLKRAGGVASIEGVRTPSRIAREVMQQTDHHLLVGPGAREFARSLGFTVEEDLHTERSRRLWLEWKRRVDPDHWLDPTRRAAAGYRAGRAMVREGLIDAHSFWGTINCNGVNAAGDVCGVTTTSGLAWKIPGRVGDSPILGAGLYVDNAVGACGSTGRGEANLYNLSSFLVVENMRRGMAPKDAGMDALRRIRDNTVEARLLTSAGQPAFDVRFFVLAKSGEYAGVAMYGSAESTYAICTENGAEELALEGLLEGSPDD